MNNVSLVEFLLRTYRILRQWMRAIPRGSTSAMS
jgi:hypothetical protein